MESSILKYYVLDYAHFFISIYHEGVDYEYKAVNPATDPGIQRTTKHFFAGIT
jgi:hypothetical protein